MPGQEAALGRAEAAAADAVGGEFLDIVGQQVVQENGGIDAADSDQAEVSQRRHDGAVARRKQFIRNAAEVAAVRCQPLAGKVGIPFLGHEVRPG